MSIALFVTGFLASVVVVLPAHLWFRKDTGAGWVYLAATSLRLIALLVGCVAIYFLAEENRALRIELYAIGIATGWIAHFALSYWLLNR